MTRHAWWLGFVGVLGGLVGCSKSSSTSGGASADSGPPEIADARGDIAEAFDEGIDANADASMETDAGRSMTTRPLLPTSVASLLIDPFVTSDGSWGHFVAIDPAADPYEAGAFCPALLRELLSGSPVGIAAPTLSVNALSAAPTAGCTAILAPFVGSTEPVTAQIWLSVSDNRGSPAPLPPDAPSLDAIVSVALAANEVPDGTPPVAYVLELGDGAPVTIAGRQWALLSLAAPVALPQGGWFDVSVGSSGTPFYLAAPEVVPEGAITQAFRSGAPASAKTRALTAADFAAFAGYVERIRRPPPPHRRRRPTP